MKDFIQYPNPKSCSGEFSLQDIKLGQHLLHRDAVCWVCKRQQWYFLNHCEGCGRVLDLSHLFRELISKFSPLE